MVLLPKGKEERKARAYLGQAFHGSGDGGAPSPGVADAEGIEISWPLLAASLRVGLQEQWQQAVSRAWDGAVSERRVGGTRGGGGGGSGEQVCEL